MRATTDSYVHAKPSPKLRRLADKYWQQRGRLLLSVKPRLNTARVNTVRLDEPAVGSLWVPARFTSHSDHGNIEMEKAICVYLNSSLGWIALIGVSSPRMLSRPDLSLDALCRIPVPILQPAARKELAAVFDSLADSPLSLLRTASTDVTRAALDDALAAALEISRGDDHDGTTGAGTRTVRWMSPIVSIYKPPRSPQLSYLTGNLSSPQQTPICHPGPHANPSAAGGQDVGRRCNRLTSTWGLTGDS